MRVEKDNFIIEYDDTLSYIPEVIEYLESNIKIIMDFFDLNELKTKKKIIIFNDLELYKKHIEEHFEYKDYMRADTLDGNINMLSLEESHKTEEHKDSTLEEMKTTILHEFVHICQQDAQKENSNDDIVWFWEALATNLGNPQGFSVIEIKESNDKINDFNSLSNNYRIAFTIGNYMLENYRHEEILDYIKYPSKLSKDSDKILDEARTYSMQKTKNK